MSIDHHPTDAMLSASWFAVSFWVEIGLGLLLPLAHVPRQDRAPGDDRPDQRGQKGLRRGAHTQMVRIRTSAVRPPTAY